VVRKFARNERHSISLRTSSSICWWTSKRTVSLSTQKIFVIPTPGVSDAIHTHQMWMGFDKRECWIATVHWVLPDCRTSPRVASTIHRSTGWEISLLLVCSDFDVILLRNEYKNKHQNASIDFLFLHRYISDWRMKKLPYMVTTSNDWKTSPHQFSSTLSILLWNCQPIFVFASFPIEWYFSATANTPRDKRVLYLFIWFPTSDTS